jgi:hypothetical protein
MGNVLGSLCYNKKPVARYILPKNKYGTISNTGSQNSLDLDLGAMQVWICDRNLKVIMGANIENQRLKEQNYVGKYIFDVVPPDLAQYFGELHQKAVSNVETNRDVLFNDHLVYVKVVPLTYFGTATIGSCAFVIPFKGDTR